MMKERQAQGQKAASLLRLIHVLMLYSIKLEHENCRTQEEKKKNVINFWPLFVCLSHLIMSLSCSSDSKFFQANWCRLDSAIENAAVPNYIITTAGAVVRLLSENEICRCSRLHTSHNWWLCFGAPFTYATRVQFRLFHCKLELQSDPEICRNSKCKQMFCG